MDLPRSMLVALLELLEADPELRERARHVLGVEVAPVQPAYVSRAEARTMGVETRALLRAERAGELPAFRVGRSTVYRLADVVALVAAPPVARSTSGQSGLWGPLARPASPAAEEPADPWQRAVGRAAKRRKVAGG